MKCQIPQISWHGRDPVLSIDFQPIQGNLYRLASGGTDSHVLIWYITYQENKSIKIECASDLYRHNKSVNVVRFSPNGEFLASGDDEGALFVWQLKDRDQAEMPKDEEDVNKEDWYPFKSLRGHLEDIYDISWSSDGNFLVSSSMDNSAIVWDMQKYQKLHMFGDYKGYIQGVAFDPLNQYIATLASDRALRIHNINTKKTAFKVQKAPWPVTSEKGTTRARLFYDDTLKSYFRRLCFTPDGELLIAPSGIVEKDEKFYNTTYVFSRHALNKPVFHLPAGDKYTVAVRCNPFLYKLRVPRDETEDKENELPKQMIDLPYRMIFAVAACDSILIYDTEQLLPFAYVSNIHYTHLTDLTWSPDGLILVASSTDGYCSCIIFTQEEFGEHYIPEAEPVKETEIIKEKILSAEKTCLENSEIIVLKHVTGDETNSVQQEKNKIAISGVAKTVSPQGVKGSGETSPMNKVSAEKSSPGNFKSPIEVKRSGKKPQKLTSIKKFFVSPKAKILAEKAESTSADNTDKKTVCKEVSFLEQKHDSKLSENGSCALSDTQNLSNSNSNSVQLNKTESVRSQSKPKGTEVAESLALNKVEAMDIDIKNNNDSCSLEIVFQKPTSKPSAALDKKPKCKIQLDFADKIKSVEDKSKNFIPDVCHTDTASVADNSKICEDTTVRSHSNENDWKLELSQDGDDIVPMEIDVQSVAKFSESKQNVQKPPTSGKRRIAFVTLSKKPTMHSQKKD